MKKNKHFKINIYGLFDFMRYLLPFTNHFPIMTTKDNLLIHGLELINNHTIINQTIFNIACCFPH